MTARRDILDKAIFPPFLWSAIEGIVKSDKLERAFYIIGFSWRGKLIIYDLVEFKYKERSQTHVLGDPHQKALLIQSLPPGLKLLGILHSHPFDKGKPSFSSIDMRDFSEFGEGLFIVVSGSMDHYSLFMSSEGSEECRLIVRDLEDVERPQTLIINGRWKLIVPAGLSKWELEKYALIYLSEIVTRETVLGKLIIHGGYADLVLPDYCDVVKSWNLFRIPYRLYIHGDTKDVLKEVKLIIRYIFNYSDCELTLLKEKREAIIRKCEGIYV